MWIATFRPLTAGLHQAMMSIEEAIHIRLHPNNINRDSGIEIPEGWMPTIKQHNSRSVPQRTHEGTASSQNNEDRYPPIINNHCEDRNAPITNSHGAAYNETQPIDIIALMKTSSKRSKRRDPLPCDNIVRQTINKLSFQTTMNNIFSNISFVVSFCFRLASLFQAPR